MSRRPPILGDIGGNQRTTLTTVIRDGEFKAAEEIIEATTDPTFLDDGSEEDVPLYMVLSYSRGTKYCRHLKLARLLVQKGANSNQRILSDRLRNRRSPSPFEVLVLYYITLKAFVTGEPRSMCYKLDRYYKTYEEKLEFLTNTIDLNGRKCAPDLENCKKLIEETSELIDVFLDYGANPSVITTTFGNKSLFHLILVFQDIELSKRFLDTCRVDLNYPDVHGSTPLMDCILRNTQENSLTVYKAMRDTTGSVDINLIDCCGETALFKAMFVGATEVATRLCKDGAIHKIDRLGVSRRDSPLIHHDSDDESDGSLPVEDSPMSTPFLAPLLRDSLVRKRYTEFSPNMGYENLTPHKHLNDKIIISSVSPLIDNGCFNNGDVASEVTSLLCRTNFSNLEIEDISPTDLLNLMFGQMSAGLRQLCVRTILDHSLMTSQMAIKRAPTVRIPSLSSYPLKKVLKGTSIKEIHVFFLYTHIRAVTKKMIKELVDILGLPQQFQVFFDMEVAKYQICYYIMNYETRECDQACSSSEGSSSDDRDSMDSNLSSLCCNSDIIYFSKNNESSSDMSGQTSSDWSSEMFSSEEECIEEECIEEEEDINETEETKQDTPRLKKIKYGPETSDSSSENTREVVETSSEDLAGVTQDDPTVRASKYQKLSDESTTTDISQENLTASESIPDSSC